ncbi:MAG: riboflavin biosynthesis protein RibF [Planctomycetes bacterium]|nr:riboflavin biosynthesis protein RibF [Planctomycetota bacterium]
MTTPRSVITIGNFDGVHAGHRAIIAHAAGVARRLDAPILAMCFDPHPATILRPGAEPPRLMSLAQKTEALKHAGADRVAVLVPTPELLALTPEDFIRRVVAERKPVAFVEGPDFRFGKDRRGDNDLLAALGRELGFESHVVGRVLMPLHDQLLTPVSSSIVRWLVEQGRVADVTRCMRQPFAIDAPVIPGEKRGRTIGVPTANLDPAALVGRVTPADGVYAGTAAAPDGSRFAAAISVGVKPTFEKTQRTIEAHLLDFQGDLYHQPIVLRFHRWLRDQQSFPTLDALKGQLARDIEQVRQWQLLGLLDDLADNTPVVMA